MAAKPPGPNDIERPTEKIIEGVGVGPIAVGRSTVDDVTTAYGKQFELIQHGAYSCQMAYTGLGLSFYYKHDDPARRIFFILISPPFRGVTTRGVVLGQTTMQEAVGLYGAPSWRTTDVATTWHSAYPGIELHVAMEPSLPRYPLDQKVHLPRPIVMIGIGG